MSARYLSGSMPEALALIAQSNAISAYNSITYELCLDGDLITWG